MENIISLADPQSRAIYFQQRVLTNLYYWQSWLENKLADVTELDREHYNIVRAISFAFELDDAWAVVYQLIITFSPYMEQRGHWETWNRVLTLAIETTRRRRDMSNEVELSVLLARLLFQQSHFEDSVRSYRHAIRLAGQIEDHFNKARAYSNLGYYYVEQGQWFRAEVLCCHALKIFEQLDNPHGLAHTENHLGFLYTLQHHWSEARQHLKRACAIWERMGNQIGLMRGLMNLGGLYIKMEQSDEALKHLKRALSIAESTKNEMIIGRIYINVGLAYTIGENLIQAESYVRQAETIFRQYSNMAELARTWDSLAAICFRQGKWSDAILLSKNSLQIWYQLNNKKDRFNTLMDLTEYEIVQGNRKQATLHLREIEQLIGSDSNNGCYQRFHSRLIKIYRSLAEQKPRPTAID